MMIISNWITHQLYILFLVFYSCILTANVHASLNYFSKDEQIVNLAIAFSECGERIKEASRQPSQDKNVITCPINFDTALCWPETPANSTAVMQCPDYVNQFDSSEKAYRYCTASGNWSQDYETNMYIVYYSQCSKLAEELARAGHLSEGDGMAVSHLLQAHLGRLQMLYTVGYSVSVLSLLVALVVMIILRRLHCPRNTIHMNMFVSFILRGAIQLLRDYMQGYNNHHDGDMEGERLLNTTDLALNNVEQQLLVTTGNWECKLVATIWMYTRLSNYVWIFVEGFYLHTLIFINTFSDRSSIKWFILIGWGSPLLFVIPWLFVRIYLDDLECWVAYYNRNYRWIIEVPIAILIVANFIFFLIIIRLLFTKLRASESSSHEARIYRYIKLAKSTLILIPLFGVHYVVFLFAEFWEEPGDTLEIVRFYFDTLFTSFQGLMVGILFCFMNGEVRAEIIKKWKRWRTLRSMDLPSTVITVSHHLTASQRYSTSSDNDSIALNRSTSRHASIQSNKSNTAFPTDAREETQFLLSIDDNQNELQIKRNSNDQRS